SKWLIERRGNAILYLGGTRGIQSWRSLQADVVQPRRLPDGLLVALLYGQQEPDLYLVEIATYPEHRVAAQVLADMLLVSLGGRHADDEQLADDRANLLELDGALITLRYNEPSLLSIFAGRQIMIKLPLIQELMAQRMRKDIFRSHTGRFGSVPSEIQTTLQG